jgi:hypothetical protein
LALVMSNRDDDAPKSSICPTPDSRQPSSLLSSSPPHRLPLILHSTPNATMSELLIPKTFLHCDFFSSSPTKYAHMMVAHSTAPPPQ